ncbi:MAG: hypothetical protein JWO82_747 [Akkermansiaceae bacterium]|nr:hypothetical protein [Akkermansiaceae bacterium]
MGLLYDQLQSQLPPGMEIPAPLKQLYDWIESRGMIVTRRNGEKAGFLFPPDAMNAGWTKAGRPGGTLIEFVSPAETGLQQWFGASNTAVLNRLCVFAKCGSDGSMAAFWLDEHGDQKIVHMGSGSGSTLLCVLAGSVVDFLRLLAIGYDEICWPEAFPLPPDHSSFRVEPNTAFQEWVETTFSVTIPATASEIVKCPSSMDERDPADGFAKWVLVNQAN